MPTIYNAMVARMLWTFLNMASFSDGWDGKMLGIAFCAVQAPFYGGVHQFVVLSFSK